MEILVKVTLVFGFLTLTVFAAGNLDRRIEKIENLELGRVLRSMLYAFVFVPTFYHHSPNTIIGPFQLPALCGNLFYDYEYTIGMFSYGVLLPFVLGSIVIWAALEIRFLRQIAN